jgi:hypothetical protein
MTHQFIDFMVVVCANIFNLLIVGVMLSRIPGWKRVEWIIGLVNIALIAPLTVALGYNVVNQRSWWLAFLPGLVVFYLLIELVLDYILKSDFRRSRGLGPYLLIFYLAQWGLIGYAFIAGKFQGFVTLFTYFLSLGATFFSYAKVRHG